MLRSQDDDELGWLARAFGTGTLPTVRYSMQVTAANGRDELANVEWTVRSFELEEQLHAPHRLEVVALTGADDLDVDALLRARVTFEIARGEDLRTIHGVVLKVEILAATGDRAEVRLRIGPAVQRLALGRQCRVFQGLDVVEIAEAVLGPGLAEHGCGLSTERLVGTHPPRDYCVQYRESDLDFVLRVLADEGISVLFDHHGESETLVLVDDGQALPAAGTEPLDDAPSVPRSVPYVPKRAGEAPVESVQVATQSEQVGRRQWMSSVWEWTERPPSSGRATEGDETVGPGETWSSTDEGRPNELRPDEPQLRDTEGAHASARDRGARLVRLQQHRDEAEAVVLTIRANATVLRAGSVFELAGAPHREFEETWVVKSIRHWGDVPAASVHGRSEDATAEYRNEAECQPRDVALVPRRRARPVVQGIHTAVVTGPPGSTIHTDRFGRVRVRMLWDTRDEIETSCWLRVALPWAGDGFGALFVPRVGSEVVVSFVDGDPDRPLCTGCVHDGGNRPPYELPQHQTRTVLKTASTDGTNAHELSFEDSAGSEEVFLHAWRRLREVVRGTHTESVDGERRTWIGGSRTMLVGADDRVQVGGDQARIVDGDLTQHVRGAMRLRVSDAPKEPTGIRGLGVSVERGSVEIEAEESIVLRCGACQLEIRPGSIVMSGPQILARCPNPAATHETSVVLTEGGMSIAADELRHHAVEARLEADRRIGLGTGPGASGATIALCDEDAAIRAAGSVEVRGRMLVAAGTEKAELAGSTCELAGRVVGVRGDRVGLDADGRIEISTPGQVNIRGQEKITLN